MQSETHRTEAATRILVIDDEEIIHASLRRILTRRGYDITGVFSAREGLARLESEDYQLIIVDLMMPEMDGLQFLESLRSQGREIPAIMITGYPTIHTAVKALRLGTVDYIAKPFTRKELLGPVSRALSEEHRDTEELAPEKWMQDLEKSQLRPGVRVILPRHAWAEYTQDGTFLVGVEPSFLRVAATVTSVSLPDEMDVVEQGYIGIYLRNDRGEEHGVAMPLSGQVVSVNREIIDQPTQLTARIWLFRVLPSHLEEELSRLTSYSPLGSGGKNVL